MKPLKTLAARLTVSALLALGSTAHAAIVSYTYTAEAANGATATGVFGWDTSTAGTPGNIQPNGVALSASYLGAGFLTGQVTGGVLNGMSFNLGQLDVSVTDRPAANGPDSIWVANNASGWRFTDWTNSALDSTDLPPGLDLADWGELWLRFWAPGTIDTEDFTFTSITAREGGGGPTDRADVPEPASLALTALAGLALLATSRRRRSVAAAC